MMRRISLATAALLLLASAALGQGFNPKGGTGGGGSGGTISPSPCIITQTVVTLAANTSTQLVAAGTPKDLHWQVTGTNPMTVSAGTAAAVVGQGINYQGAPGTGQGGGAESFSGSAVPVNAFQAISAAGTTATVWGCY